MPTATQITYLHLCHRKLWLFSQGLNMEHQSALVAEGKLLHDYSYKRRAVRWRELAIEGIKIDHYDAQQQVIREIKKSRKKENVHIAQVKYYLFVLERNGIAVRQGILEYPLLRETEEVWLSDEDRQVIPGWEEEVERIVGQSECPELVKKGICKKCAYYEFCFS